jgi:putative transposase
MGVSERFACRVTGQHRTTQRHHPAATTPDDPDAGLRQWLRDYAKAHPRWGHRRAYHDARGEGWQINHKKIQRLWREEGLRVPQRRRRKRLGTSTAQGTPKADAPNKVWAVDFQFDATTDGRPVKIVSIVDEHTRECLGGLVDRSITGEDLINELDRLAAVRGYPGVLRCDNGPELACAAMADWAGERVGLHFIPPGDPWPQRLHRVVRQQGPRRVPQHQHLLGPRARPRRDRRLETGLQPPPTPQRDRLPGSGPVCEQLHPQVKRPTRCDLFAGNRPRRPERPSAVRTDLGQHPRRVHLRLPRAHHRCASGDVVQR